MRSFRLVKDVYMDSGAPCVRHLVVSGERLFSLPKPELTVWAPKEWKAQGTCLSARTVAYRINGELFVKRGTNLVPFKLHKGERAMPYSTHKGCAFIRNPTTESA